MCICFKGVLQDCVKLGGCVSQQPLCSLTQSLLSGLFCQIINVKIKLGSERPKEICDPVT